MRQVTGAAQPPARGLGSQGRPTPAGRTGSPRLPLLKWCRSAWIGGPSKSKPDQQPQGETKGPAPRPTGPHGTSPTRAAGYGPHRTVGGGRCRSPHLPQPGPRWYGPDVPRRTPPARAPAPSAWAAMVGSGLNQSSGVAVARQLGRGPSSEVAAGKLWGRDPEEGGARGSGGSGRVTSGASLPAGGGRLLLR